MKKKLKIFAVICIILFAIIGIDIICSQELLSVTRYEYKNPGITETVRIVQLSDLHNSQFGKDNRRLVKKVKAQSPDMILITGDMLNKEEERTEIAENLVKELRKIAPVYYSFGNHEKDYMKQFPEKHLQERLEKSGAVVLEKEYADVDIRGQKLRIGGAYGYFLTGAEPEEAKTWIQRPGAKEPWDQEVQSGTIREFMNRFQDTERCTILLSHLPEGLLLWKSMENWEADLVFGGHVHGGQIRLPGIGGLYDPEEGFNPTYTKGMHECGNGTMVLSAGLGSSQRIPRVNNLPEIVVCDIQSK